MSPDQFKFYVIRWFVSWRLRSKKLSNKANEAIFFEGNCATELEDAKVLYRLLLREIRAYNAALETKITLLNNMQYKSGYLKSAVFSGIHIPHQQIDKLIADNPNLSEYEIFKMLID